MYCDHVVLYRFTPVTIDQSECDITWLVRGDAVEGQDYDRDRLTWHDRWSRTRLVILNSPGNPTGVVLREEELARVADACRGRDLVVLDHAARRTPVAASSGALLDELVRARVPPRPVG